jgi:hypothetical protein
MATETKEIHAGSNVSQTVGELPKHSGKDYAQGKEVAAESLGAGSFTTFYTWRGNGVIKALRFNHGAVNANSRVFVSISEFDSDARINRFIGDARMCVANVAPFNGGFFARVEVSWNAPLNARFDVLVDP